jgi:hypothetical protein
MAFHGIGCGFEGHLCEGLGVFDVLHFVVDDFLELTIV